MSGRLLRPNKVESWGGSQTSVYVRTPQVILLFLQGCELLNMMISKVCPHLPFCDSIICFIIAWNLLTLIQSHSYLKGKCPQNNNRSRKASHEATCWNDACHLFQDHGPRKKLDVVVGTPRAIFSSIFSWQWMGFYINRIIQSVSFEAGFLHSA